METADKAVGSFIQFFEKLITDFTWRRFTFVVVFIILIGLIFFLYESYTQSFMLTRLDRETTLLEKVITLEKSSSSINDPNLVKSLNSLKTKLLTLMQIQKDTIIPLWLQRVVYTLIPWIVIALFITINSGFNGSGTAIIGMALFALPLVIINTNLPNYEPQWINNWLLPWIEFIVIVIFVLTWQKSKKRKQRITTTTKKQGTDND